MTHTMPLNQLVRVANALLFAFAVTFGLLTLMNYLIDHDLGEPEAAAPAVIPKFVYEKRVIVPEPKKPPKLEDPKPQPKAEFPDRIIESSGQTLHLNEGIEKVQSQTSLQNLDLGGGPIKLVAVAPNYPTGAITRGLEGYVDIQFDIDISGTTRNIRVLDSSSTLFHRAVISAVERWKYRPKMEEGKPVAVFNVVERVSFILDQ